MSLRLVVATVGKAHGLTGEVSLVVRTDTPRQRFAPGQVLFAMTLQGERQLTVQSSRVHQARWLARFVEVTDRTQAESLRHCELEVEATLESAAAPTGDRHAEADEWFDVQLRGLQVATPEGALVGSVCDVEHYPAHDVLVVQLDPEFVAARREAGAEPSGVARVPLVRQIVTGVDLPSGQVIVAAPAGLWDV